MEPTLPSASRLTASAPVLLVRDLVPAANYYRDCLGFHYDHLWGQPPDFVILERDQIHVMLHQPHESHALLPHWRISPGMWNAYFWVTDADALCAEFRAKGARIDYEPHDKPYGVREFGVQDLDGHDLGFGQLLR